MKKLDGLHLTLIAALGIALVSFIVVARLLGVGAVSFLEALGGGRLESTETISDPDKLARTKEQAFVDVRSGIRNESYYYSLAVLASLGEQEALQAALKDRASTDMRARKESAKNLRYFADDPKILKILWDFRDDPEPSVWREAKISLLDVERVSQADRVEKYRQILANSAGNPRDKNLGEEILRTLSR